LREPPTDLAEADLIDDSDIDDTVTVGDAFRKPPPGRERQPAPILIRQQRAEAAVVEQSGVSGGSCA